MPRIGRFTDMNPTEARVLACLVDGMTNAQVAKATGISVGRVNNMRINPRFRAFLAREVNGIVEATRNRLLKLITPSTAVLAEILLNKGATDRDRIAAANSIINSAFKCIETSAKALEPELRDEIAEIHRLLTAKSTAANAHMGVN